MIKRIFNTQHSLATDIGLLLLRLAIGGWMLAKGFPKIEMLFSGSNIFPAFLGLSSPVALALTVFAQVVCSILLMAGAATRFATLVLAINMLVAVVVAHRNDPFVAAEPALHFLLVYVVLLFTGCGKYAMDYLIGSLPPLQTPIK